MDTATLARDPRPIKTSSQPFPAARLQDAAELVRSILHDLTKAPPGPHDATLARVIDALLVARQGLESALAHVGHAPVAEP